jgi:hypothetical protein
VADPAAIDLRIRTAGWADGAEIGEVADVEAAAAEIARAYPSIATDDIPADDLWRIVDRHRFAEEG